MPVSYTERRRRREQLTAELPPDLRARIALRHVETVSKFSPEAQRKLAEALAGGVRIPAAIEYLKANPEASLAEIFKACPKRGPRPVKEARRVVSLIQASEQHQVLIELTDLLKYCYPDMPSITAQAMAGSGLLSGVRELLRAQQACFATRQIESDFVLVVFYGLVLQTSERLTQIITQKPIYRQALEQSGVPWLVASRGENKKAPNS